MKEKFGLHNLPEAPVTLETTLINKTGSWKNIQPVLQESTAPCTAACPAGIEIPLYFDMLIRGRFDEAAKILHESNPFPSITGRVCPHFCEQKCNRGYFDEAIGIRGIERYLGDLYLDKKWSPPDVTRDEKVAVVGSGPAGLSAAHFLRKKGYRVTVFERDQKLGGVLRYGIPDYRLPKDILDREIEALKREGIEFKTGVEVGKDISFEELKNSFDAVFFGTGAPLEREMRIPGEELFIKGVEFLKDVNTGKIKKFSGKVAVVGGGNVAMDVARSLLRLGATPVVLYRRTEKEMPAIREEVERAMEDGIEFKFLTLPVRAEKKNGKIELTNIKMKLGEPDETGRRRPIPIEGSEFTEEYDAVITAIGELADLSIFPEDLLNKKGWLDVDLRTTATKDDRVFAGGDLVLGPATVIEAIALGKRAAINIDRRINGLELKEFRPFEKVVEYKKIVLDYFMEEPRQKQPEVPVEERIRHFDVEEVGDYTPEQVQKEALRCFSCGHCNGCGTCWVFCPDMAIGWENDQPVFIYDYCKGCGICSAECPRDVIQMVQVRTF